jgi:hypothetical protein
VFSIVLFPPLIYVEQQLPDMTALLAWLKYLKQPRDIGQDIFRKYKSAAWQVQTPMVRCVLFQRTNSHSGF